MKRPYHWFVTSPFGWATDNDLRNALNNHYKAHKHYMEPNSSGIPVEVWQVPGPHKGTTYDIKDYAPQVEGALRVGNTTEE